MRAAPYQAPIKLRLSEFRLFARLAKQELGLNLPDSKLTLVESRLQSRLKILGLRSFSAYADYLQTPQGKRDEAPVFVNRITTHKTDFLREPEAFRYLVEQEIPLWLERGLRPIRIWSAACSTGEEPYTMAMYLAEAFGENNLQRFSILASDVSPQIVELARKAIYAEDKLAPLPQDWRHKYTLRSKDRELKLVRMVPELRALTRFAVINLLEPGTAVQGKVQAVLVRNVMIYFDRPTRLRILRSLCQRLIAGGCLVVGHSESLHGLDLPLKQVSAMVYRRL